MVSSILPKYERWSNLAYWKMPQRSFFGRIKDNLFFFRDLLTFRNMQEKSEKIRIRRLRIGCRHLMNKIYKSLMFFVLFFCQTNHPENWLENFLRTYFGICCLIRWTVYSSCSCIISNDEAVYFLFAFFLRLTHFFRMRRWFDRKN